MSSVAGGIFMIFLLVVIALAVNAVVSRVFDRLEKWLAEREK